MLFVRDNARVSVQLSGELQQCHLHIFCGSSSITDNYLIVCFAALVLFGGARASTNVVLEEVHVPVVYPSCIVCCRYTSCPHTWLWGGDAPPCPLVTPLHQAAETCSASYRTRLGTGLLSYTFTLQPCTFTLQRPLAHSWYITNSAIRTSHQRTRQA